MKCIIILFITSLLAGCVIGDPDPFLKGDIKAINDKVCIYTKNASANDKYIAYGISQYPDWNQSENLKTISPVNAWFSCLPYYDYQAEVKYSVVYVVENAKGEKILYDAMFMVHRIDGETIVERLD